MQELVGTQEIRQQPALYVVNLRQKVLRGEPVHLIPVYLKVCEYYDTPKLALVLPRVGLLTGMLLFSMSFYYGLARLVMWVASL